MTATFYSISPFGTGDQQTGAGDISVDGSGVGTFTVPQTGNIGIGCAVEYNSIVSYISEMTSPTSAKLITAIGGTAASQGSTSVTSIHHVWASIAAADAAFTGASFLNSTDFVADDFQPELDCYYDHDDQTADTTAWEFRDFTTDASNSITLRTPTGGTESINDQRNSSGVWDDNKFKAVVDNVDVYKNRLTGVVVEGLQIRCTSATAGATVVRYEVAHTDSLLDSCFIDASSSGNGVVSAVANISTTVRNCPVYNGGTHSFRRGIYQVGSGSTMLVEYCTVRGFGRGLEQDAGTFTAKNTITFDNDDDFAGTITSTDCASDDNNNSGTGDFQLGTYSSIFTDYVNNNFTLLDFTGTGAVIEQATAIGGITEDTIGVTRDASTPDVGSFEFLSVAAGFTLKTTNGISGVLANMRTTNGASGAEIVLKRTNGSSGDLINTSGV